MDIFPDLFNPVWLEVNHHLYPEKGISIGHTFYLTPEKSFRLGMIVGEDSVKSDPDVPPTLTDEFDSARGLYSRNVVLKDYPELQFTIEFWNLPWDNTMGFVAKRTSIKLEFFIYIFPERREVFRRSDTPFHPELSLLKNKYEFINYRLINIPWSHDDETFETMKKSGHMWKGYFDHQAQLKRDIRNSELGKILSLEEFLE